MEVTEILCIFRLVQEGKTEKEIPPSSKLEFLEKFLANNSALSDAAHNISGLLNRGGIADLLLLKALLAISQKPWEQSYWEVMDSFVLLTYASSTAPRTLLLHLLACLTFTLDSEDLFCWYKSKKWFVQATTAAKAAANHGVKLSDICNEGHIYINSNLNPLTKFTSNSRSNEFKDILPWSIPQIITKTAPISMRIVMKKQLLWTMAQHKQLKTMEMSEAWPDIYNEEYIHQFQSELTHKIHWQQQKHWV